MKFYRLGATVLTALLFPAGAEAGSLGWTEARFDDGRLVSEALLVSPVPDLTVRWWRHEDSGGSGWLGWGGFQAGALQGRSAPEGERAWGPGTRLSSGHWGADWDAGPVEVWAVQSPETLEVGAQGRLVWGPLTAAAGADRRWALSLPLPESGPWEDRVRGGLRWASSSVRAGVEALWSAPSLGTSSGEISGRFRWDRGPWMASADGCADTLGGLTSWTATAGWGGWALTTQVRPSEGRRFGACWMGSPGAVEAAWGPDSGWMASADARWPWEDLTLVCGAEGRWNGTWSWGWEAGVGGPAAGGQWSARWVAKPDGDTVTQTWSAAWVGPPLEASVRWTVEGLTLGWFGPRSSVSAQLRWLF